MQLCGSLTGLYWVLWTEEINSKYYPDKSLWIEGFHINYCSIFCHLVHRDSFGRNTPASTVTIFCECIYCVYQGAQEQHLVR